MNFNLHSILNIGTFESIQPIRKSFLFELNKDYRTVTICYTSS